MEGNKISLPAKRALPKLLFEVCHNRFSIHSLTLTLCIIVVTFVITFQFFEKDVLRPDLSPRRIFIPDKISRREVTTAIPTDQLNSTIQSLQTSDLSGVFSIQGNSGSTSLSYAQKLLKMQNLFKVKEVDCRPLFAGMKHDLTRAISISKTVGTPLNDQDYINLTKDCEHFQSSRGYIMSSLSEEERDFPLAFSMLVYKDSETVERFLRAIYRPQNYYCIHVDQKSPQIFYRAISSIANCFPNVFMTSKRINVQWSKFSVLEPELICMEELWRYKNWKYFFTTTGQEFPLKTNHELVKILTAYKGANDLEGTIKRAHKGRWRKGRPPHGIRPVKGSVHITANRDFVDYILHNQTAKDLLLWTKDTQIPDETYFATLNHNPQLGIRGSYKGEPETGPGKPFLTRYKHWGLPCAARRFVRRICILTTGDLPRLGEAKHYFANKFFLKEDRVVIGCLEEMIFNRTRDEYLGIKSFNTSYYANLLFVKNRVL